MYGFWKISDLVQEYCAAVGEFEASLFVSDCAGESALHVPKKLTLQNAFWERSAINRDKRSSPTTAFIMNCTGDQLLACSRFSGDVHWVLFVAKSLI